MTMSRRRAELLARLGDVYARWVVRYGPAAAWPPAAFTSYYSSADPILAELAELTAAADASATTTATSTTGSSAAATTTNAAFTADQGGTTMTVTDPETTTDGPDTEVQLPAGWRGVLAPLDTRSGDGRIIATPAEELRVRTPPVSLLVQLELDIGHDGAQVGGRIDRAWVEDGLLMGEGPFDLGSTAGREGARLLAEGFCNGVSVDLDDMQVAEWWFDADGNRIPDEVIDDADWDQLDELIEAGARPVMAATDWRLMTATLVSQPAFDEARIEPVWDYVSPADNSAADSEAAAALLASVVGDTSLPVGDRGAAWSASAAQKRIFEKFTGSDGNVDAAGVAKAYLYRDPDGDPATQAAYKLPFADVVDGTLTIIPKGVAAAAGGRGVDSTSGIPDDEKTTIKNKICTLYGKIQKKIEDWPDCPFAGESASAAPALSWTASAAAPEAPPAERVYDAGWFADPKLTGPTPLTITDDGRVYGHLAAWGTCHTGFSDVCFTPPPSHSGYAYFHVGEALTSDGPLPVGRITLGAGHADTRVGYRPAQEHYDNTCSCVAVVRAGEDDHGIWVAGALVDDVTADQIAALRRSPLSGDWRRIGGNLELMAAHCVNMPGYPVPRAVAASVAGRQMCLVAAGALAQPRPRRRGGYGEIDYRRLARMIAQETAAFARRRERADQLARRVGRSHDARLAAVDARIGRHR
jgi:hypothetical protein